MTEVTMRAVADADIDDLFVAFAKIVEDGEGFPQSPPLDRPEFDEYWLAHSSIVVVARGGAEFAGAYYLKPNFVGRASHIANAGYFVTREHRSQGIGRRMVEHSLEQARRLGFDALMFNLVFESNEARRLYERLGFEAVGRIPRAVDGEDAIMYWRPL